MRDRQRLDIGQDSLRFLDVIASRNAAHASGVLFKRSSPGW
jgi:hypothetical protein